MEVGSNLRETRLRLGISIDELEERTKIRAKYLRALENEEWDLLPGPAYIRSFLRTYADTLGLDAQVLLDEYRRTHEGPGAGERFYGGEPVLRGRRNIDDAPRGPGRGSVIVAVVIVLLGALFVLGTLGGDDKADERAGSTTTDRDAERTTTTKTKAKKKASKLASVKLEATAPVFVCLVDATGKRRVNGVVLQPGDTRGPYRSRRFRLNLGNAGADVTVNGNKLSVPGAAAGVGFDIRAGRKASRLADDKRPTCQ
ncbi:MAG: helix-turn-helix domain-containing protein [Solirubrobacterales bacterium]